MSAISTLRQHGLLVTGFELAPNPGGIWNTNGLSSFTPRGLLNPIYPSMRCILPKELMAFSDRAFPFSAPHFPHNTVVTRYLHEYAESHGVACVTRFNTKVESVRYDVEHKCWRLVSVNVVTHDTMEWAFDRILVCSGQHQQVRVPEYDAVLKAFVQAGGEVMHSAYCKNLRDARRKNIVVVGDGVGAYDMCRELLRNGAKNVTHSTLMKPTVDAANVPLFGNVAGLMKKNTSEPTSPGKLMDAIRRSGSLSLASLVASLPFVFRNQEHRANEILTKWLRFENRAVLNMDRVGPIVGCEGRSLLVREDPTAASKQGRALRPEILDAALRRDEAAVAGRAHVTNREKRNKSAARVDEEDDDADRRVITDNEDELATTTKMLDSVDWIVFATGYRLSYPFLPPGIRQEVEGGQRQLRLADSSPTPDGGLDATPLGEVEVADDFVGRRGLFLGTVYKKNPSLAFIGSQRELLPPFLLFEAQNQLAAGIFTGRNRRQLGEVIPPRRTSASDEDDVERVAADSAEVISARLEKLEDAVLERNPQLQALYSARGMGLTSGLYHRVLQEHAGCVPSPYALQLAKRWWHFAGSGVVHVFHKMRSLAPLKRKQQHVLVSNDV